jgi:hypothetical protein
MRLQLQVFVKNPVRQKERKQMEAVRYLSKAELEAGMDHIRQSPKEHGTLRLIVCRPKDDEREVVAHGELSLSEGLIGDNWKIRGSKQMADRSANPDAQITVMNARTIELIAQEEARWSLAGDQLYVDMDLSDDNLPPGTRLAIGSAIIEVSAQPHTGCRKFSDRFGVEAMKFVNSPEGKRLRLRGMNTRLVRPGVVRVGDVVSKVDGALK